MEWMLMPLKRYAAFGGRSRRREYWMFVLFCVIVFVAAAVVDYLLGLVPLVGSIVLIVFYCLDGTVGANRFGPDPKTGEPGRPG